MPDFPYVKNRDWVNKSEGWVATDPTADALWFERTEAAIHQGQDHEKLVRINPAAAPTDGQALVWDPVNNWYTPGAVASGGAAAADYGLYMGNFLGANVYEGYFYHSYVFSPARQDLTLDYAQFTALFPNMNHHFYVFEMVPAAPATNDLYGENHNDRFITPASLRCIHYQTFNPTTYRQDLALAPAVTFEQGKFYEIGLGNSGGSGASVVNYSTSFPSPRKDIVWVTPMAATNSGGRRSRRSASSEVIAANLGFNHSGITPAGPMPTVNDPTYTPPPALRPGTYKFTDLDGAASSYRPIGYSFVPSVNITVTGADLYNTFGTASYDLILGQGDRADYATVITELSRASGIPDGSGTIQAVFPAPIQLTAGVTYDFSVYTASSLTADKLPSANSGNANPPEFAVTRVWGHAFNSQYTGNGVYLPSGLVYQVT